MLTTYSCVAALGALATIMTSLTGFFSQQLVQFGTCLQRDGAAGVTVAKTNNYTAHGVFLDDHTADEFGPMVAAINVGLTQPVDDHSSALINGCVSGNCTFPSTDGASISTLGISYACTDILTHIRQQNGLTTLTSNGSSRFLTIQATSKAVLVTAVTDVVDNALPGIADISMLFRQRGDTTDFAAVQCSLFPSVNTYAVNTTDSIMSEQQIESLPLLRHGMRSNPSLAADRNDTLIFPYKMATNHTYRNGSRELCKGSKDPALGLVKMFLQETMPFRVSLSISLYLMKPCIIPPTACGHLG